MRHARLLLCSLLLVWGLPALEAQDPCVPTPTAATRVQLAWEAPPPSADDVTPVGYLLRRTGTTPFSFPLLPFDTTTYTDTGLTPGPHGWELQAQYQRSDGSFTPSDLAPGTPPPCVVVAGLPPIAPAAPPQNVTVGPFTTVTGVQGLDLRWTLDDPDQVVHIARRHGTDATQPFRHVGSAPQGFWFDTWHLSAGETYCYRVCLDPDAATCSAAVCAVFLGNQ